MKNKILISISIIMFLALSFDSDVWRIFIASKIIPIVWFALFLYANSGKNKKEVTYGKQGMD